MLDLCLDKYIVKKDAEDVLSYQQAFLKSGMINQFWLFKVEDEDKQYVISKR